MASRTATSSSFTALFTGQGSQRLGMMKDLLHQFPTQTKQVAEKLDHAVQFPLSNLLTLNPDELPESAENQLRKTSFAQPALLAFSSLLVNIIQEETDLARHCRYMIGHSLGEYSALVATGALDFDDALGLVYFRGQAMERAMSNASDPGAMAALMPISTSTVHQLLDQVHQKLPDLVCDVANYNSSKQIVISGHARAIDEAIQLGRDQFKVRRGIRLPVGAPFHSALMKPAAQELEEYLKSIQFNPNTIVPVVSNVTAQPLEHHEMKRMLVEQMVKPVRWFQSIEYCAEEKFYEFGYGGALSRLVKQHQPSAIVREDVITAFRK